MFEKLGQQAERFATRVPRRRFFEQVAKIAVPATAALAGFLALSSDAMAIGRGPGPDHKNCCMNADGVIVCRKGNEQDCPNDTTAVTCPRGPGVAESIPSCY